MPPLPPSLPVFDPRSVPIVGVDAHLPPVAPTEQQPDALRRRFAMPPPWTPEIRREPRFMDRAPAHAAVLVPIVLHPRPTVLLTERTTNLSTHSGQVAFPGGRTDPEDRDAIATALREAEEEVGLERQQVEVLGELSTYVTGSSFIVTPVVGLVEPGAPLRPNPGEVADVFEVPLDYLLDPAHHQRRLLRWEGHEREWFAIPYEDHGRTRFIWGATAGMLRNLYRFLAA
ncbi:NUDIX domain-containing protein [Melaminivora alkalimesophila]|uniref:NUDIX domain-containing protein n=2 Tax=Melaminivora alkalimesophila TaxID=1165852 RepID=A0A317RCM2_9BURK|nr:CoA pyrophosphatase [Melaminivora alkalimesophila]PWW47656.1 NUDIX domain-containing protein [Melaminivora alkalimesophila]